MSSNIIQNFDFLMGCVYLLVVLYCFNGILIQYRYYLNTKYKFRFYALRDDLYNFAINGEVEEDSDAFENLRDAINYSIYSCDNLSIQKIMRAIRDLRSTNGSESGLEASSSSLTIDNKALVGIAIEYLRIHRDIVKKNSWFEIGILRVVVWVLCTFRSPRSNRVDCNDAMEFDVDKTENAAATMDRNDEEPSAGSFNSKLFFHTFNDSRRVIYAIERAQRKLQAA